MADLPVPESFEQIQGDMLSAYASKLGINDYNTGSSVTSFFEVVALAIARSSGDIFQVLLANSIDRATGSTLQAIAAEYGITPTESALATGFVNVIDTSFSKISTKIYAGTPPPNIGSTTIFVSDASSFTPSGNIYIGRGTPNVEGPIPFSSPTNVGNYWSLTLGSGTSKFHNLSESVILAQGGNRTVPINTVVVSPSIGNNPDIQYQTTVSGIILDGETEVDNIPITAFLPGSSGNVPIGAISKFATSPFPNATVTNAQSLTSGTDTETDDQLRVQIKRVLASIGLGTATAVKNSLIGVTATDENATIVSDSLVTDPQTGNATVYIDDGTGYEAKTAGVGIESIVDSAIGGEKFFQLATGGTQAPVAKAFLQTVLPAPFDLIGGDTLAVVVGGVTYQHVFTNSDFRSPGGATAYEVTASINADTLLGFEATTSGNGTYVVIRAIAEDHDNIQITTPTTSGRDAAVQMGFPGSQSQTLRLDKNNIPLSKDGSTASVFSQAQALWSGTIANGDTLILSVDGTQSITYTITNQDFIATGLYNSVSATNSLASWVQVLNNKLTGVTASAVGQQLEITSNLGASNRAQVIIDPSSTLVSKNMFATSLGLSSTGKVSDFTLDRNTAQFELAVPLVAGDKLAAGTTLTQATVRSNPISGGSVNIPAPGGYVWMLIDGIGKIIPTGVAGNTFVAVSANLVTNTVTYTSVVSGAFANVVPGDYIIIWSPELATLNANLEARVHAVRTVTLPNDTIDIVVTNTEAASVTPSTGILFLSGLVVLRSNLAPQKFRLPSGTQTLDQVSQILQSQSSSLSISVFEEKYLVISSTTKGTTGSLLIVTSDTNGSLLNIVSGSSDVSKESLIAFYDSQDQEGQFPLFLHSKISADTYADPINSYVSAFVSSTNFSSRDPNELISFLNPYGGIDDEQPEGEVVQEMDLSGTTIDIEEDPDIRRIRTNDRFFIASPLDFGNNDSAVVVLDNNPAQDTFQIPFYRVAKTNTNLASNSSNFDAYDVAFGPTASFSSSFGAGFDFSNFKVLMQARKVLKPSPSQTAILYRATPWGRSGEHITVRYVYPSVANAPIGYTAIVGSNTDLAINLKSGASVPSSIDGTTEWNVTITANTPSAGIDQVTYTWNGTGTNPALTLSGGEYVNITTQGEFNVNNTGIFRVSTAVGFTPTATSFTVQMPNGMAVPQSGVSTQVPGTISFYSSSSTTALQISTFVNANMSRYVSATLVNDGGSSGSGVISLSTFEDSGFAYDRIQLLDGINWIASSPLTGSPDFILKRPLSLTTDVGYAFNAGESIVLVPTTIDQVNRFINVLPVTGFSTIGTINTANRGSRLELSTDTVGSTGYIQIIGGTANEYSFPVLGSAFRLSNSLMVASANNVASAGVCSDQWFRLQAQTAQSKELLLDVNSSMTIFPNNPTLGQSTIKLLNRNLTQRYFGKPRNNVRVRGDTFRVEKQGSLVCLSWNGVGTSPAFTKAVNFNDSLGGTLNVSTVSSGNDVQYIILSGNANFTELSIGDLVTISGLSVSSNNGTFLVTGVSNKILQVANPNAKNQFSSGFFTLTGNPNAGDAFVVGVTTLIAGTNFAIGGTNLITAANLAAVIGTIPGVQSSAASNVVTVTATVPSSNIALSYTPASTSEATVSGPNLVGPSFVAGQFSASIGVSEGDTLSITPSTLSYTSPFSPSNQGQFRVIRQYNNSVWFENSNVVEEEVVLPYNAVNLGFDATTSFKVNATNNTIYLNWNGIGTEPTLGNAEMGDVVTFGTDFAAGNQGSFMVSSAGAKLQQITQLSMPAGSVFPASGAGVYFTLNSAGNVNQYYVWFNVNGGNTDPAPIGLTGLMVAILNGDNASQVASKTQAVLNIATGLTATVSGSVVTVTTTDYIETNAANNVNMLSPFTATTIQLGRRTFLEVINPSAVNQSPVFITTSVLQDNRPQMLFEEYDGTVIGDNFVITGTSFGSSNAGSYSIIDVIDQNTVVVSSNLAAITNISLSGLESAVYVDENKPYYGYKHVSFVTAQPGTTNLNYLVLDSTAQYEKINQAAGVEFVSLNKLDFSTVIKQGLDSYKYNTGLIREANRVVYGDPRDPVSYPGVGAAGADIFIREPLTLRVQVSIDVRLQTGVVFSQVVAQVRSNVSSLINSNPVGQSISISSIVSVVNSIPGVTSVAISSPQYDATHDLIFIAPSEKSYIIDPSQDISVSQLGT